MQLDSAQLCCSKSGCCENWGQKCERHHAFPPLRRIADRGRLSRRISPAQALAELFADDDSGDDWLLDQFDDGQDGDDGEDGEGHDGDDDDDAGGGEVGGGPDGVRVQNGGRGARGGVGEGGNGDTDGHSGGESDDGVSDGGGDHDGDGEQFADKSHRAADEVLTQGDGGDDGEHFFPFHTS